MDSYEATRMVFAKIQSLDPENASKVMGYLLLQDHGEKEMIRLAFGPESLVHNLIFEAKTELGLLSLSSSPPTPIARPPNICPLSRSSSSITITNNNPSPPSTNPWTHSIFPTDFNPMSPNSISSRSYASMVNGNTNSLSGSLPSSVYNNGSCSSNNDVIDEHQLQDHLSFLSDCKADELFDPMPELTPNNPSGCGYNDTQLHRRSYSVPGVCFSADEANSGFGWKPCLYFARGFCKNGTNCRFLHGDSADSAAIISEFEQCQELLRSKSALAQQHHKLAAASEFMSGAASFPYRKCMNFLQQQQQQQQQHQQCDSPRSPAAAALMMGEEFYRYGRCRMERNGFPAMPYGDAMNNPGSRQIYLTFPADSTFREEDVSNHFSIYGPVQDVRIPYQQKRMFGFVTFVYPETVKMILAKGNPHFVCDSRVLVKPYKEKGKVQEKKQQYLDRRDYASLPDLRDPLDLHLGARMFYNTQEMLLRRKLEEQADLQQAIELQGRRLVNLQLLDLKTQRDYHQYHHALLPSSSIPNIPALNFPLTGIDQEIAPENDCAHFATSVNQTETEQEVNSSVCSDKNGSGNGNSSNGEENKSSIDYSDDDLHESLEHILPDNLFTSPKKSNVDHLTVFSNPPSLEVVAVDHNNKSTNMASSLRSCFLQIPRFSSGSENNIGI